MILEHYVHVASRVYQILWNIHVIQIEREYSTSGPFALK